MMNSPTKIKSPLSPETVGITETHNNNTTNANNTNVAVAKPSKTDNKANKNNANPGPAQAQDQPQQQQQPTRISIFQGRFLLDRLLGRGGFGEVYRGVQTNTQELVAVKLERSTNENSFLFHEARVMQDVQRNPSDDGHPPIAVLKYFGQEGEYRMLIMTLHGASLEDMHERLGRFSLRTTVMLADQMVSRIEYVHRAGYVHRDLKPDNFLVGLNENCQRIYLIDFGLTSKYLTREGGHRAIASGKSFVGTSRYASSRTHQGYSQGRRDDIEQLVYIMIYLHLGRLPWTGLRIRDRDEKEKRIGEMKAAMTPEEISAGCPRQFSDLLYYARNMLFDEAPAYDMIHALLRSIMADMHPSVARIDNVFDWLPSAPPPALSELPSHLLISKPAAAAATAQRASSGEAAAAGGGRRPPPPVVSSPPPDNVNIHNNNNNNINRNILSSNAKGQGMFSGFGSGAFSQDIVSLGDKN